MMVLDCLAEMNVSAAGACGAAVDVSLAAFRQAGRYWSAWVSPSHSRRLIVATSKPVLEPGQPGRGVIWPARLVAWATSVVLGPAPQHALRKRHCVEEEVLSLATNALVEDDMPADMQQAVAALAQFDTAALWQVARRQLTPEQSAALESLLFKQQREGLTPEEKAQLEQLRHEHGKTLLVRASAIGLFQERGEDMHPFFGKP